MKKIFTLLLAMAVLTHASAADTEWRKAAREFIAEQEMAPIEIKPGTRFKADLARERMAWMQRVLLPPFEKHLAKWPAQAEAARSFVKQAFEGHGEAKEYARQAKRHPLIKDYPGMLVVYLNDVNYDIKWPIVAEITAKARLERYTEIIKSAPDATIFGPQDDEVLLAELDFIFTSIYDRMAELEKLCETPHFTPWLREMLQGKLQNQIAWSHRNGNVADAKPDESQPTFEEQQIKARTHFLKAWELHPDRAAAAASMIDIVKGGNGRPGETPRQWFDRALAVQFDHYPAYDNYLDTLRQHPGGSLDKMKAFYFACALTDRDDTALVAAMRRVINHLAIDSSDIRQVLSRSPMKDASIQACRNLVESKNVYRVWEHPWRLADLGMIAWVAGDYETADDILQQVPVPFPRETRRSWHLHLHVSDNETNVRAQSRLFALGLNQEWDAAEGLYQSNKVADALQSYQDITARFQGEPPTLLLERIAACKFERAFATVRKWVSIWAEPDLAEWHRISGSWTGLKSGTLVNNGLDAQAYIVHNGRSGTNFELMGEYEVKDGSANQGLDVMLGYHIRGESDHHISCMQWEGNNSVPFAGMRSVYTWPEPEIIPPSGGKVWKFHILCRNGAVTYRLNHRDIVVNYHQFYHPGSLFEMPEDSAIGFAKRFFNANTHTHIRRLKIRRLDPPADMPAEKDKPVNLAALRISFDAACMRAIDDLNASALTEAEVQADELKRIKKDEEAAKMRAFISQLKSGGAVKLDAMPESLPGEVTLDVLLRGYYASVNARLAKARSDWKTQALALHAAAQDPQEAAAVMLYVSAHLEDPQRSPKETEDPLASANRFKWTPTGGQWTRTAEMLAAGGRSTTQYEFDRKPPFQIDFDINARDSRRPQVVFGNVKLADDGTKTFGLYPQPGTPQVFTYQPNKLYHVTLKATLEKTELLIDGTHVCDGAKVEGNVSLLRFLSGNGASSGSTEFHKIRISPLP